MKIKGPVLKYTTKKMNEKHKYPPSQTIKIHDDLSIDLVFVEGGSFTMGGDRFDSEKPEHPVKVPSFYMGKYQVIQRLWQAIMGNNPSVFKGENRPVENISWNDSKEFIKKLNKETGKVFRLPTEAEWEYAARGGIYSQGYVYAGSDKLKQVGWYRENSNSETHDVGLLLANELGLYDMSGNVREWCEDDWYESYRGAPEDGSAWIDQPTRGVSRVLRGGSFFDFAVNCRAAYRSAYRPDNRNAYIGLRLVLSCRFILQGREAIMAFP